MPIAVSPLEESAVHFDRYRKEIVIRDIRTRDISPVLGICDPRSRVPFENANPAPRISLPFAKPFRVVTKHQRTPTDFSRSSTFIRRAESNAETSLQIHIKHRGRVLLLREMEYRNSNDFEFSKSVEPRIHHSSPLLEIRASPRWRFAERKTRDLSLPQPPSPPVSHSRGSRSRFRACFENGALASACTGVLDVSREIARGPTTAAAAAAAAAVAAVAAGCRRRCPIPEVKVRRVGTGCARIHFFGLALDFFSPPRPASISFPCMRRRPSLHGRLGARYPLARQHMHSPVCIARFSPPRPRCTARLCKRAASSISALAHICTHACSTSGTLVGSNPWLIGSLRISTLRSVPARPRAVSIPDDAKSMNVAAPTGLSWDRDPAAFVNPPTAEILFAFLIYN